MSENAFSLFYPEKNKIEVKELSETTLHDLGIDSIVKCITKKEAEQTYILRVMSKICSDAHTANYRAEIFEDVIKNPSMREEIMSVLDKINFLRDYGSFKREREEAASTWELMHRLEEINDYINCVEALSICLSQADISSEGLVGLKKYINDIYSDNAFEQLKKDIAECKASTSDIKSVTLGINLNSRFEAETIGLISINNKSFTKSNVIGNFNDMILAKKGGIKDGNEWNGDYKYHPFTGEGANIDSTDIAKFAAVGANPITRLTLATIPEGDNTTDVSQYMDRIVNHILSVTVKKLKDTLSKYINITITNITGLIPEFMYYIRWAEYIEKLSSSGLNFAKAVALQSVADDGTDDLYVNAKGIYNLKLAAVHISEHINIVSNDIKFSKNNGVYILTGANRGGKTTITQAVGQLFVLAQGGIFIPGISFEYKPVDCIYTHFPADEDKTMDLGRLGEECKRFKELYLACTSKSLLLLNETFSTTSFEEGYYIAKDSIRAILTKGIRTIYNTHMHKLAFDIDEINKAEGVKAQSLVVKSDGGDRSFKIEVSKPEGMSYANDIAIKYGVTYEMLTKND